MKSSQYRERGQDSQIRVAIAPCTLGFLQIAATDEGVCAIDLDDNPQALRESLCQRFPRARLDDSAQLAPWLRAIVSCVDDSRQPCEIPLDIRGTAFQRRVWKALRRIPAGATLTYTELAKQIGKPKAARAVAGACAANQLAVAIPCHRVVRKGGELGGYRWGVQRKRSLLAREGAC